MQQEGFNEHHSQQITPEVQGINELDKRISKLQKTKSTRNAFIVAGVVLLVLWLAVYFGASAATSVDSSSVALLGPILSSPFLILGILLIILGVVGRGTANKRLNDARKTREILVKSRTLVD